MSPDGQLTQAKGRKARHKSGSKKREESKVQACKAHNERERECQDVCCHEED